ncbi:hypothetical protein C8F01DRAFT_433642 [Mycena amicta]|nr:hypothetical protein C8F01DRAFT_433642 [Mycena amicta]
MMWDKSNPEDRSRWHTQHNPLKEHLPPYVYHVKIGDRDGFIQAIRDAIENPIPRRVRD